jgi:6-phosphogluconate dehydrogenase (decarboxylating)
MVHHGSSPFSHIFPTKNRDTRIPFMAPFGIIHRFTGKKKGGAGEVLEMMHCSIFFAVLRSQGTHLLNDSWHGVQIRFTALLLRNGGVYGDILCWLVVTGTMEFYDFPFSWEWNNHPN